MKLIQISKCCLCNESRSNGSTYVLKRIWAVHYIVSTLCQTKHSRQIGHNIVDRSTAPWLASISGQEFLSPSPSCISDLKSLSLTTDKFLQHRAYTEHQIFFWFLKINSQIQFTIVIVLCIGFFLSLSFHLFSSLRLFFPLFFLYLSEFLFLSLSLTIYLFIYSVFN